MPEWRPWKVDCTFVFAAGGVAVMVASLYGCVDGVEWGGRGS